MSHYWGRGVAFVFCGVSQAVTTKYLWYFVVRHSKRTWKRRNSKRTAAEHDRPLATDPSIVYIDLVFGVMIKFAYLFSPSTLMPLT